MIDVENEIFSKVAFDLKSKYPNVNYTSVFTNSPPSYPLVSIEEIDNVNYEKSEDSSCSENHVRVTYEINIYTKDNSTKKTEAKNILEVVDNSLLGLGFLRLSKTPIQGDDETIYRIVLRYSGVVSKTNEIFRR